MLKPDAWADTQAVAKKLILSDLYGEVAKVPQPMVAQAARAALAKLEASER